MMEKDLCTSAEVPGIPWDSMAMDTVFDDTIAISNRTTVRKILVLLGVRYRPIYFGIYQ